MTANPVPGDGAAAPWGTAEFTERLRAALILAKFDEPALRRVRVRRIQDNDGTAVGQGGIERLTLWDTSRVLPGVRLAVEGYVDFCRLRAVLDAVAASLTELSAPGLMRTWIAAFEAACAGSRTSGCVTERSGTPAGDGSAGRVVRLCDGHREVSEIVATLAERFSGAPVADEVPRFLAALRKEGWLR